MAPTYRQRRHRLQQQLDHGLAVINSPGPAPDPSLFDKNLLYLTGLESRQAVLIMSPEGFAVDRFETITGPEVGRGRKVHEALFVEERSARTKLLDGEGATVDDIRQASGVEHVYHLSQLDDVLARALMKTEQVFQNIKVNGKPLKEYTNYNPYNKDIIKY